MGSGVCEFSGVIILNHLFIEILKKKHKRRNTREETNTNSAPLNAAMMINIHVSLAWMPVKALLAHGRAISAGTSRILGSMEEYV